jgi:hypothetical protein
MDQNLIIPNRPSVMKALTNGFKDMAMHAYLIAIPILLDLGLLLGPRLTVEKFMSPLIKMIQLPPNVPTDLAESVQTSVKALLEVAKAYSLTAWLRTLPFGTPSLMAGRISTENPLGAAQIIPVTNLGLLFLFAVIFTAAGLFITSLYYTWNAFIVYPKDSDVRTGFLRKTSNLLLIPIIALLAILVLMLPIALILGISTAINPVLGTIIYFSALLVLINLLFPLLFTPHAIILENKNLWDAAKESIFVYKKSGIFTSFFVVVMIFATYLSDRLWQNAPDGSWMILVGIFGHAVVSTALVLASFYFFKDAKIFAYDMAKLFRKIAESEPPQN